MSSVIDFPELEILGCPATYDRLSETYVVNFQWRVPFSPAALSHIEVFAIRADIFNLKFTLIQVGVFFADVPVHVSYLLAKLNI